VKILFTGASSFTGFWFVNTLAAHGHEVVCPLRGDIARYEGVRKWRAAALKPICRLIPEMPFGSDPFLELARENGPWDLLCHHAAEMTNYRSPDFDALRAAQNNTLGLRTVLGSLKDLGLKGVVLTGTVFENDEGAGDGPLRAFSPYGVSKALTYQVFRYYCHEAVLPLGKFIIPNPFGPFEEPRFTAYLMQSWREGKTPSVRTPDYVRDNIHADLLAAVYARFSARVAESKSVLQRANPSGYIESQGAFAQRVAREVGKRLGWACELEVLPQQDFSEPLRRVNREPASAQIPGWDEARAWDDFAAYYSPVG